MTLNDIRERVNVFLHPRRERVLGAFRTLNVFVTLIAFGSLIAYYGYPLESSMAAKLIAIIKGGFAFYILHFLVRWVFDFHPLRFIRAHAFEAIIMGTLVIEGISDILTGKVMLGRALDPLGIESVEDWTVWLVQAYFLVVLVIELSDRARSLPRFRLHPATLFILSFLFLILSGTGLLMLPEMTADGLGMGFLDALFTSTSATCVTGLMIEDAETFFSHKGHVVLMVLIKLGGLNIIAFGSLIAVLARFGVGVRQHEVIEDFVNSDNLLGSSGTLGKVVGWCLGMEALGAAALMALWSPDIPFASWRERLFSSVFHSISAFNNAGITLFTDGLAHPWVAQNWLVHWIITILVFVGALGMVALFDLFDLGKLKERMRQPWKTISFPTKIALYFSIVLVAFGTIAFAALEWHGTMSGMSWFGKMTTAVFQSVTRTSGFNTVDIGAVGMPMLFLLLVLMFIGASSSSTGGGIKTSTLAIVLADVWRTVRGGDHVQIFKRSVGKVLRSRAYSVLLFFLVGNLVGVFVLTLTEGSLMSSGKASFFDIAFEHVSAMGTVGLSTGITPLLSSAGKLVLSAAMFVGRVGTLTVAFAVGGRTAHSHFKYPEGHTMVG